jgi:NADP-dependent 3-hydroxy acid dehydrogenase YdfG
MSALKNKVALITGGSSGIGLATAKRFVVEGAYVFITGRRQPELGKAVTEIGKNVTAVQGDIEPGRFRSSLERGCRKERQNRRCLRECRVRRNGSNAGGYRAAFRQDL